MSDEQAGACSTARELTKATGRHIVLNDNLKDFCKMPSFLFWNLQRKSLAKRLAQMAAHYDVDVIVLAENQVPPGDILSVLNEKAVHYHFIPHVKKTPRKPGIKPKVEIYSRFHQNFWKSLVNDAGQRFTVRLLATPEGRGILVAAAHLPSKLDRSEFSQAYTAQPLARAIETAETRVRHSRTVLVGDLNMSPYHPGVASALSLHGVMSRKIAEREERTVNGRAYRFFYNPMWSLMGDFSHGPAGTFYRSESEEVAYFWHTFDQVLIRPALLDQFDHSQLRILDNDGYSSLLTDAGHPDKYSASDHLPLFFTIDL